MLYQISLVNRIIIMYSSYSENPYFRKLCLIDKTLFAIVCYFFFSTFQAAKKPMFFDVDDIIEEDSGSGSDFEDPDKIEVPGKIAKTQKKNLILTKCIFLQAVEEI
jgi:hypothetical protein